MVIDKMKMLFIFLDGVGKGEKNEASPFFYYHPKAYDIFLKDGNVLFLDATLGIEGLPQSATGQVTIYSGINAAKEVGFHINGQIAPSLKRIIERQNIFTTLLRHGFKVDFANVYRNEYLQKLLNDKNFKMSVTSYMTLISGIRFKTVEDLLRGEGVYFDITNHVLIESGYEVPVFSPQRAAENLLNVLNKNDFVLFEHFKTDIIGHSCDMEKALELLKLLDEFILSLIEELPEDACLVVTSDHGNIEDLSTKTHTKNKVPFLAYGNKKEIFALESIEQIYSSILKYFEIGTQRDDKER
ncbi:metalloenzyme domain protein [Caldicellulosiruptor acetigenus I77R1B]|uniref:Metalloenzyme domain protein n=1 Tax=Caldicellulosiruptor acetigenus (strain ATCC 700853 / DSM 12137 / I77R1B) TaxID=632335 RepID=E4S6E1_CALA7|nr:alkaline phosphatase family protein [Caldicellulosiruptor acetigenus]ADQ41699.1 metalloenzyme domain protein [Caldicellulosiruptor acetigenus I77R1B]